MTIWFLMRWHEQTWAKNPNKHIKRIGGLQPKIITGGYDMKPSDINCINYKWNLPRLAKLITISASSRKRLSCGVTTGEAGVAKKGLKLEYPGGSVTVEIVLYRSNMNIGAALCLVRTCGRGRCGSPRMERISRCISLRSWLRSRRWMKLERTSLSMEKLEKATWVAKAQ